MSLIIGLERRHRTFLAGHDELSVCERFGISFVDPRWPGMSRADRNHSFNPCVGFGGRSRQRSRHCQTKK